jgi:uncharacterized damage-inducible protein DinB
MRPLILMLVAATATLAQDNPLSAFNKMAYTQMKTWVLASAEKMPESNYAFQPTDSIRTFGHLIGHVGDAQYFFCSAALGEKNPGMTIEKTKTAKADIIASLKEAFAYCDKAYDGMTDAAATEKVKLFGRDFPKLGALSANAMHMSEHYGNIVTYLRLKNIVPPSSEPK